MKENSLWRNIVVVLYVYKNVLKHSNYVLNSQQTNVQYQIDSLRYSKFKISRFDFTRHVYLSSTNLFWTWNAMRLACDFCVISDWRSRCDVPPRNMHLTDVTCDLTRSCIAPCIWLFEFILRASPEISIHIDITLHLIYCNIEVSKCLCSKIHYLTNSHWYNNFCFY